MVSLISKKGPKPIIFSDDSPSYFIEMYDWILGDQRKRLLALTDHKHMIATRDLLYFIMRISKISNKNFHAICSNNASYIRECRKILNGNETKLSLDNIYFSELYRTPDIDNTDFDILLVIGSGDYRIEKKGSVYHMGHDFISISANRGCRTIVVETYDW